MPPIAKIVAASRTLLPPLQGSTASLTRRAPFPVRAVAQLWARSARFKPGTAVPVLKNVTPAEKKEVDEAARLASVAAYERGKMEQVLITSAVGLVGTAVATAGFSPQDGVSFGVGAAGSLLYLSLLQRSVDAVGERQKKSKKSPGSFLASQRLLIPGVLMAGFDRWNHLFAPQYGGFEVRGVSGGPSPLRALCLTDGLSCVKAYHRPRPRFPSAPPCRHPAPLRPHSARIFRVQDRVCDADH